MLYLNLISGRNPKYLIDEQVKGAKKIKKLNIDTIPTAYIFSMVALVLLFQIFQIQIP